MTPGLLGFPCHRRRRRLPLSLGRWFVGWRERDAGVVEFVLLFGTIFCTSLISDARTKDLHTNIFIVANTNTGKHPTKQTTFLDVMALATMAATDLASDYIQQCLGFTSLSSKILSLERIQTSLRQCGIGVDDIVGETSSAADADADVAVGAREDWRAFLEDGHHSENNIDDGSEAQNSESNVFMLRDSFIKCLVESCDYHGNVDRDDTIVDGDEDDQQCSSNADRLVTLSFLCLTSLASLVRHYHHHRIAEVGKRNEMTPIFGREFALAIAPAAVAALRLPANNIDHKEKGPSHSASALIIELLHPNRPKCEARSSASILRDSVLVPASTTTTTTPSSYSSVAMVAHVLSSCVIAAVVSATSSISFANSNNTAQQQQQYGEEELSVREETAALGKLQDMRDVLTNVGLACSRQLCSSFSSAEGEGEMKDQCAHAILDAMQDIFDIAPFAVGSQLEALLDDEAKPILDRLRKMDEEKVDDVASEVEDRMLNDKSGEHTMDKEEEDEREQAELEETIPHLYDGIVRPPIPSSTIKNLDSMLLTISENLGTTDADLWDVRLDALIDLECILAGGVTYMSEDARYVFIERIRKMPLEEQFTDLRSQITQQVCRVVIAVSYEYRNFVVEDVQLLQAVSQFVEGCIQPLLTLSKSGTKLMANQGVNCIRSLFAVCGVAGYARTVPRLCEVILDKKAAKNQKRACVIALTVALRVWEPNCFMKHLDQLILATKEGATNRDSTVREEGRKLYWAMVTACDETKHVVQNMFSERSREMKTLEKEREKVDAEWNEDGAMSILVQTGVVGATEEHAKERITANRTLAPSEKGIVPPRNSAKRPGTRLRAMHGTPFKSQRCSTPMKTAGTTIVNSSRKPRISAAQKSIQKGLIGTSNVAPINSADDSIIILDAEKENSAVMAAFPTAIIGYQTTPSRSSPFYENLASPMTGTPIANLLARASPLPAEKVKDTGDFLGELLSMLSDRSSPHDQSIVIKALVLFAKENPCHPSWLEKFPLVLNCLLGKPVQLS